jgi:hypothetical protein
LPSTAGVTIKLLTIRPRPSLAFKCGAYMTLFSYCLRSDMGAAPNPFWGVCTLVICKPAIRRTAKEGDWVVGLGAGASPLGDISDQVVYAMCVTRRMPMREERLALLHP